ncbi:MAG: NAD-dependent epimerase/dehydratase family protein [Lysobacterales bacterium]
MNVLLTGSSGWLGQTLTRRLKETGHTVFGLDPVPSPTTSIVGSIADADLVRQVIFDHRIEAIIHTGALHKPNISTHSNNDFVAVNVQGTLNLLEATVAAGSKVDRFIFTSTTSLMISKAIRAGFSGGARKARWITEELQPLLPRNIYGVTKLAAEHLCRMFHEEHGLPVIVLRTARFFPEEDDMAQSIEQTDRNTKANELLFRRLTVEDAADCHLAALDQALDLGFDSFIVSAKTPFRESDCTELLSNAPAVVERYFPEYPEIYRRQGWTMFPSIDRVYDATKLERKMRYVCKTGFAQVLGQLENQ